MSTPTDHVRIIVQARMSSSRLACKSLLPVGGMALAVLAAKRAARDGAELVVATSTDVADDVLAAVLASQDIKVFRGPLTDVLGRYAAVSADLADHAIILRLTADNVFPDAEFIARVIAHLRASDADICEVAWPESGLPYGLAAQAFYAHVLRTAHERAVEPSDREDVGPWIARNCPRVTLRHPPEVADLSALRCTIDSYADYQRICRVFDGVDDPVAAPWAELCERLGGLEDAPKNRVPGALVDGGWQSRLVLGTVQLGMDYGIANLGGQPDPAAATALVRAAIDAGVSHIDTARGYGTSESIVGAAIRQDGTGRATVITKLSPLDHLAEDAPAANVIDAVETGIFRSCRELSLDRLPVVLLHRADHRHRWGGAVWRHLQSLRDDGVIGRLGVSATDLDLLDDVIDDPHVGYLQIPLNLLDRRWRRAGIVDRIIQRADLVVHARSCFLQGVLLVADVTAWPRVKGLCAEELITGIAELADGLGRENIADLCIAYAQSFSWVDGIVIGMESLAQLEENIRLFGNPPLGDVERELVDHRLPEVPDALVDPSVWPHRSAA